MKKQRNIKRKSKIRYGKLFLFISALVTVLFLLSMAIFRGIHYILNDFHGEDNSKPVYYLLVGTDAQSTAQADFVMIASIDSNSKKVTLISIPGNTKIGKDEKNNMTLKSSFSEGNGEEIQSAVENLLHIRISQYAVFDYHAFKNLIDKTGNIELYVERPMSHDDKNGVSDIWLHRGYQSLDAEKALSYMRYIDAFDGEIGRIQREERFIKAMISQMQKNFPFVNWLYAKYYWKAAETNITSSDAASIAYELTKIPIEDIRFIILPGEMRRIDKQNIWIANPVEIQKIIGVTLGQSNE